MPLKKPRLKSYLTVFPAADNRWILQGGEGELWRLNLTQNHYEVFSALVPLLNGTLERQSILEAIQGRGLSRDLAVSFLDRLEAGALLEEADTDTLTREEQGRHSEQIAFFSRFTDTQGGAALQAKLRDARVDIVGSGTLVNTVAHELASAGVGQLRLIRPREDASVPASLPFPDHKGVSVETAALGDGYSLPASHAPSKLLIVGLESWDPGLLESINEQAVAAKITWLLVQARSLRSGTVGPLFIPGTTACYMCLDRRLASQVAFYTEYEALTEYLKQQRTDSRPSGALRPSLSALAGLTAVEAIKHLAEFTPPALAGAFLTVDWFTLATERHEVLKLPRCAYCRGPRIETFPWSRAPLDEDG